MARKGVLSVLMGLGGAVCSVSVSSKSGGMLGPGRSWGRGKMRDVILALERRGEGRGGQKEKANGSGRE